MPSKAEGFGEMVKAGVPNPFSWHWGVFVLVFAAVVLLAQALKPQPNPEQHSNTDFTDKRNQGVSP